MKKHWETYVKLPNSDIEKQPMTETQPQLINYSQINFDGQKRTNNILIIYLVMFFLMFAYIIILDFKVSSNLSEIRQEQKVLVEEILSRTHKLHIKESKEIIRSTTKENRLKFKKKIREVYERQNNLYKILSNKIEAKNIIYKTIAICTIIKNENLYLKQWVDFYKDLGVDKIILYDNNDLSGERPEDVLEKDIKTEYVDVINYRGMINKQLQSAYTDCYKRYKNDFNWIFFSDVDEYLYIENGLSLRQFLGMKRFDDCEQIGINWMIYGDNNLVYYENKTLIERFGSQERHFNPSVKSFVRGGLAKEIHVENPHFTLGVENMCGTNGEKMPVGQHNWNTDNFNFAYLRHFFTKTAEEFRNKLERKFSDLNVNNYRQRNKARIKVFFELNELTPEKLFVLREFIIREIGDEYYMYYFKLLNCLYNSDYIIYKGGRNCIFPIDKRKYMNDEI